MTATAQTPLEDPTLWPLGPDGLLVRMADRFSAEANARALALHGSLQDDPPPGLVESAPALASLHIRFDRAAITRADFQETIKSRLAALASDRAAPERIWHIPAQFGAEAGPQLNEVAELAGLSPEAMVAELCATELQVLAIGFAPGQPYLGTLPPHWDMPRQSALTPRVPTGSIVTAIRQIVLFANPSPTGWRQLGRCAFRPFRPVSDAPFALRPGDALRFHRIGAAELSALEAAGDPDGGARLEHRV